MRTNEIASVMLAIIVLAGLGVALASGSQTVGVLNASAGGFSQIIRSAAYGRP